MGPQNSTAKVITILDYFGFLCLLGFLVEKDDPAVKFHTNQGLILFIFEVIVGAVDRIFSWTLYKLAIVGTISRLGVSLLGLACTVLAVYGIINAAQDKQKKLPVIGNMLHATGC